jgi:hypothetical protein
MNRSVVSRLALCVSVSVSACGSVVQPDASDVQSDVADSTAPDRVEDARDVASLDDVADTADVARDVDASDGPIVVPCDPERPAPAGVGRSCTAANAEQCREVHYCGGTFVAGHPDAFVRRIGAPPYERFQPCDFYRAVARSGYIDTYEVTVARFRRWVEAGRPTPAVGTRINPGVLWTQDAADAVRINPIPLHSNIARWPNSVGVGIEACTWTPTPGANEDLPMNCVGDTPAIAFCWWDGKQLMNEVAYEYLATNRGTTITSFGAPAIDSRLCDIADVGALAEGPTRGSTLCPRRTLPLAFDARPRDVTSSPAGVRALFGGLREWMFPAVDVPPGLFSRQGFGSCDDIFPRVVVEGEGRWTRGAPVVVLGEYQTNDLVARSVAWSDDREMIELWRYATSRVSEFERSSSGVDRGFRCQRWERP